MRTFEDSGYFRYTTGVKPFFARVWEHALYHNQSTVAHECCRSRLLLSWNHSPALKVGSGEGIDLVLTKLAVPQETEGGLSEGTAKAMDYIWQSMPNRSWYVEFVHAVLICGPCACLTCGVVHAVHVIIFLAHQSNKPCRESVGTPPLSRPDASCRWTHCIRDSLALCQTLHCSTLFTLMRTATTEMHAGAMEPLSVADGISISPQELGKFDVTVANILAAPIMRLQPIFAYFTRPGKE